MSQDLTENKIVVMGSGAVGKSALTIRLVTRNFLGDYDPTIEDCYQTNTVVDDEQVALHILDTAGQDEFKTMRDEWIREGGDGFLLVYSIVSQNAFDETLELRNTIIRTRESDDVPIVLVGNMCDLKDKRVVTYEQGAARAAEWGVPFVETSALNNINTEVCFHELVREIKKKTPKSSQKKPCRIL